jgi:hypothetical protein
MVANPTFCTAAVFTIIAASAVSPASAQPVQLLPPAAQPHPVLVAPPVALMPGPAPQTYALLPGHWKLDGATYVWVPPETMLRPVDRRQLTGGHYAWLDGRWVWVPVHREN